MLVSVVFELGETGKTPDSYKQCFGFGLFGGSGSTSGNVDPDPSSKKS